MAPIKGWLMHTRYHYISEKKEIGISRLKSSGWLVQIANRNTNKIIASYKFHKQEEAFKYATQFRRAHPRG